MCATFTRRIMQASTVYAVCILWAFVSYAADAGPAFPGAEGAGAIATGGRGGEVYFVTNLNDSGAGSLRDATSRGNRIILFKVAGTIALESPLDINESNITIAGQSAPGGGVCLRNYPLMVRGDNIIIRFLRMRPGDEAKHEGDALTIWGADRVMIDHCSMSWSTDSVNDVVRDSSNVTVQWSIISEPLNNSVHSKGAHGYGTGWGSGPEAGNSYHHNLLAHCNSRSPRLGSERGAQLDVRNNVIYNIGTGWAYGGEHAEVNYVGNYYRPGPNTRRPAEIFRISSPHTRMFLGGNVVEGNAVVTRHNLQGLTVDDGIALEEVTVETPFSSPPVVTHSAEEAYELVLAYAGATLPRRDAVDERIIADVRTGTGQIIDSQRSVGGWPDLTSSSALQDTESRSDDAEPSEKLNSLAGAAGGADLENYLNELAAIAFPPASTTQ